MDKTVWEKGAVPICSKPSQIWDSPRRFCPQALGTRPLLLLICALPVLACLCPVAISSAQEIGLPAPRLLTIFPPGGQAGTSFPVDVGGEAIEDAKELLFSNPQIVAKAKLTAEGKPEPGKFIVVISPDAPPGIHEARLMTRLGVSTSRAFVVGSLTEVTRESDKPNTTPQTAIPLEPDVVVNGYVTPKAVDYYRVHGSQGRRLVVDCAAAGIDSKLTAVLIVADAAGHDLVVNRRGGLVDFTVPADGDYFIKVQDLTYQGGARQFYRLAVRFLAADALIARQPSTAAVNSCSCLGDDTAGIAETAEIEPNDKPAEAQKITLPAQIAGRFFPAADVDLFEFEAKKGETWWVEVASERLGLPTDPFVMVQRRDARTRRGKAGGRGRAGGYSQPAESRLRHVQQLRRPSLQRWFGRRAGEGGDSGRRHLSPGGARSVRRHP